jgi:hypothetical protein
MSADDPAAGSAGRDVGASSGPESSDRARLLGLNVALIRTRALQLMAEAGVADELAAGPLPVAQVAAATGTHPDALYRLLRLLTCEDLVREVDSGVFALTSAGELLCTGHPESLHPVLVFQGRMSRAYADAMYSLRTGRPAFPESFGRPLFEHLRDEPELGRMFDASMARITRVDGQAVVAAYDFGGARRIVDVAGGDGSLLTAVLTSAPDATGVLFDQPHVVPAARHRVAAAGLAGRCEVIGGDFFGPIPPEGDLYLLKWILHDWPDDKAVAILRGCREAMAPDARLLVVEQLLPSRAAPHPGYLSDIAVLVVLGGRERTLQEYQALLAEAGLSLHRVIETDSALSILEVAHADQLPS